MLQENSLQSRIKPLLLIALILTIAVISRASLFNQVYNLSPVSAQQNDTRRYEEPALQLLQHGTLAIDPTSPHTTTLSTTPVYSLFIAGVYKTFGLNNRYALILIQILVSALTIFMIYLIALQIWNKSVAIVASLLMLIEPLQILYSQIVLSETLFTFFLIFSLFAFTRLLFNTNKFTWALILGISLTLATMTRPISYYLMFCIALGLIIFKHRFTHSWRQLFIIILLTLLPFLLVTHAWKTRNAELTGVFALNDAMSETMLYWKAKGVLSIGQSLTDEEAQQAILKRLPAYFKTPKERADAESKLAKEIILGDLKSYLKLSIEGLKAIVLGPGILSQAIFYDNIDRGKAKSGNYKPWYLILMGYGFGFIAITYLFATYGFLRAFTIKQKPQSIMLHLMMLGTILYFIIISTGHIATDSRMRVPIIPIILLYGAFGIQQLLAKIRTSKAVISHG